METGRLLLADHSQPSGCQPERRLQSVHGAKPFVDSAKSRGELARRSGSVQSQSLVAALSLLAGRRFCRPGGALSFFQLFAYRTLARTCPQGCRGDHAIELGWGERRRRHQPLHGCEDGGWIQFLDSALNDSTIGDQPKNGTASSERVNGNRAARVDVQLRSATAGVGLQGISQRFLVVTTRIQKNVCDGGRAHVVEVQLDVRVEFALMPGCYSGPSLLLGDPLVPQLGD